MEFFSPTHTIYRCIFDPSPRGLGPKPGTNQTRPRTNWTDSNWKNYAWIIERRLVRRNVERTRPSKGVFFKFRLLSSLFLSSAAEWYLVILLSSLLQASYFDSRHFEASVSSYVRSRVALARTARIIRRASRFISRLTSTRTVS